MTPIPLDVLRVWIGRKIHLTNCPPGCVWTLVGFKEVSGVQWMELRTPKTKRQSFALPSRALYLRGEAPCTPT